MPTDPWSYLKKLSEIVGTMPPKNGVPPEMRVRKAWAYYADLQMRTGMTPRQCLTHARQVAKRESGKG